jgi:tRNA (guanosine-2'-O-)-methyltransferase
MTRTDKRTEKINSVLRHRQPDLTIVMENIHDPHNVSAMLRSADAVGVMQVQLVYTHEVFPRIGTKSSASARKWVSWRKFSSIDECYSTLRSEGFGIYATHLGEKAVSLYSVDLTQPVALVFGNEHRGVSDEAAEKADGNFLIPMVGMIQSLNVSVACAVSLYEAFRQRMETGHYKSKKFQKNVFDAMFEEWLKK